MLGGMAKTSARAALILLADDRARLESLATSRTASVREVERARILLGYSAGEGFSALSQRLGLSRRIIYKHVDRALAGGVELALSDRPHGSEPVIPAEAKAWVLSVACTRPKDHGLAAELWTCSSLANRVREAATVAGYPALAHAGKATVHRILRNATIRPHKIKYYMERRDPDFDTKMREVLIVYREINELLNSPALAAPSSMITVSVDEKPGVQALATTSPDLGCRKTPIFESKTCPGNWTGNWTGDSRLFFE